AYGYVKVSLVGYHYAAGLNSITNMVLIYPVQSNFQLVGLVQLLAVAVGFLLHHGAARFILVARAALGIVVRCFLRFVDSNLRSFHTFANIFQALVVQLFFKIAHLVMRSWGKNVSSQFIRTFPAYQRVAFCTHTTVGLSR